MSRLHKKLTPEVMQALRSKPGFMPLKVADVLWPTATTRVLDSWTRLKVRFFQMF
ncbi:hypothetical protein QFZ30_002108 [Arthrobacter pascens]|uniref:hypothetical protein n=1 Tax=Arthrobacter pascens TaxID=1677 RepID=UPI00278EE635|nr:hypothetical protein [Arthrobacter pascens]MDQ0678726.1 hypothetical protein [Arthrobacter pascens]